MKFSLISALAVSSLVLLSGCSTIGTSQLSNKEKAIEVQNNFGTADRTYLNYISDESYLEHNLSATSGKSGLIDFLDHSPVLPKNQDGNVIRVIQDGDYVVTHSYLKAYNAITFDVFRFKNGLIVEHWDNIQPKEKPNASGRTQIDGTTKVTDLDKTVENKKLINGLIEDVMIGGQFNKITQYISTKQYIQHSPWFGDGIQALAKGFAAMAAQGQVVKYTKVHAILGEGNFVLAISEGESNGAPTSFYDLFRIENGKAVEHWDVVENVLPKSKQMNNNGKFNFPASAMTLSE